MPDTTWPISRTPARLIPGWAGRPVSMSSNADFDTSSMDRSRSPSWPTPDALRARLAPRRSPPRLLTAAARGGLRPPPAGRPRRPTSPIGLAPPSPMQHRINRSDLLHRPPHAFVAHPTRLRSPKKAPVPDRRNLRPAPDRASREQFHASKTSGVVAGARLLDLLGVAKVAQLPSRARPDRAR
jgi:hypothetical protein